MRRLFAALFACLAVAIGVPGWSGDERLDLLGSKADLKAVPVQLDPRAAGVRQLGALRFLGGVRLTSGDPAFGGYSALHVVRRPEGARVTMLSDGGNLVQFTLGADWRARAGVFANLPAGPGTGWTKADRDSESLVVDGRTGTSWVGFEGANAVFRFTRGFAASSGAVAPRAMKNWQENGGPEAMARLPDGRFAIISEQHHMPPRWWHGSEAARLRSREALIFPGDPLSGRPPQRFAYMIEGRYDVADAAALPDGSLLVLERAFSLPYRFHNRITLVAARDVAPGRVARGKLLATLDAPLIHDNFEGLSVTRENGTTIIWLVSDDNQSVLQRTLLLKFALPAGVASR